MILDKRNEFCDAASVASAASANWVNIGSSIDLAASGLAADVANSPNALLNLGTDAPLFLVIRFTASVIAGTNGAVLTIRLVSDSTAVPSVSAATVHLTGSSITCNTTAVAGATAGVTYLAVPLPAADTYERYLAIQFQVTTQLTNAGAIDAFLTPVLDGYRAYADATN